MVKDLPEGVVAVVKVPTLLSVRSVAALLDISPQTIRRRIDDGDLPAVRDHDRLMVRGDDLRAYIDRLERVGQRPGRAPRDRGPRRLDFLRD